MGTAAAISVVITSAHGAAELEGCVTAVLPQCARTQAELIVVLRAGEQVPSMAGPPVRVVRSLRDAALPQRRSAGLAEASGDWVAMTETPCVPAPDWLARLLEMADPEVAVLGGAIKNARHARVTDCGAYFAEYGIYGATERVTLPSGAPHIATANVAYHRVVVAEVTAAFAAGEGESVVHERLHAARHVFRLVPEALVRFDRSVAFTECWRDRFGHGRAFAGARRRGHGLVWRTLRALTIPALVPLLAARIARAADPAVMREYARALPVTLALLCAWTCGEATGYLSGERDS